MLGRLLPREGRFFDLFRESADLIVAGTQELRELLADPVKNESRMRTIKDYEHQADKVTHQTVELLHQTFITPLDREDIHQLITKMDDILDFIDATSERLSLYGVTSVPKEVLALADVCVKSAEQVKKAVSSLHDLRNPDEIIRTCVEINRLENEGDHLLRSGIAKLFRDEPDTRQLIKIKEIFELLETATDRCEDVANVIEGIVLEYA